MQGTEKVCFVQLNRELYEMADEEARIAATWQCLE